MKTTLLATLLGASLFLGGCGSQATTTTAASPVGFHPTFHVDGRTLHPTIEANAAAQPLRTRAARPLSAAPHATTPAKPSEAARSRI